MFEMAPVRTGNWDDTEIGRAPPKKLLISGVIKEKSQVIVTTLYPPSPEPPGYVGIGGLWPPASARTGQFKPFISRASVALYVVVLTGAPVKAFGSVEP